MTIELIVVGIVTLLAGFLIARVVLKKGLKYLKRKIIDYICLNESVCLLTSAFFVWQLSAARSSRLV